MGTSPKIYSFSKQRHESFPTRVYGGHRIAFPVVECTGFFESLGPTTQKKTSFSLHKTEYPYLGVVLNQNKRWDNVELRQCENKMDNAVRMMASTPIGRFLLKRSNDFRFSFCFDDAACEAIGANGFCSPEKKIVAVKSNLSTAKLASVLIHEMAHTSHMGNLLYTNLDLRNIKLGLAIQSAQEADARAHQALFMLEYSEMLFQNPEVRVKAYSNSVLLDFQSSYPLLTMLCLKAFTERAELDIGQKALLLRTGFEAYYKLHNMRAFYEEYHIDAVEKYEKTKLSVKKKEASKGSVPSVPLYPHLKGRLLGDFNAATAKGIKDKLNGHSVAEYIEDAAFFERPENLAVHTKTKQRLSGIFRQDAFALFCEPSLDQGTLDKQNKKQVPQDIPSNYLKRLRYAAFKSRKRKPQSKVVFWLREKIIGL